MQAEESVVNESAYGRAAAPRVIIVGNLTLDDVVMPDGRTSMGVIGGNSLYAALGALLWTSDVGLVTRRGEDFPAEHQRRLEELGVALDGVVDIPGLTLRNWMVYESDGRRHGIYRGTEGRQREVAVQPEDIPSAWLAADPPPHVHVAGMPLAAAEAIVDRARRDAPSCVITLDTIEDYGGGDRERLLALAAKVDVFMPSQEELFSLMGYDDPPRALAQLAYLATPTIIAKLGAEGCLVRDARAGSVVRVGISAGETVDVTGAGDAFCGGFVASLAEGQPPAEAARRGAVSAAFAVGDFGSLSLAEVTPQLARQRLGQSPPSITQLTLDAPATAGGPAQDPPDRRAITFMRLEIDTVPDVIALQRASLAPQLQKLTGSLVADGIEHLFLSGCGDSMFAGMGSCLAFGRYAGLGALAVHALDLARYRVRYLPPRSAVVCISSSGQVGRTIEAAAQAREHGHRVIALTSHADGRLAGETDDTVLVNVRTLGGTPGTSTYAAMQSALLLLASMWGERRGRSQSDAVAQLEALPQLARATLTLAIEPARAFAAKLVGQRWVTFLGAGPNEASARFGAAKMMEGPQVLGTATNIEEWAHEEYFVTGAGTPVVLIAPSGASYDRALEVLSELTFIGALVAFVSDREPPLPDVNWLPFASGAAEEVSPVIAALPLNLLAFFLAEATGKRSYNFPSAEAEHEHYETIHRDTRGLPA